MSKFVRAAQTAIDSHAAALGLETGNGSATELWHLVYSLLEWCDVHAVDFDAIVSEVRLDMQEVSAARAT